MVIALLFAVGIFLYFSGKFFIHLYLSAKEDKKKRKLLNEALQNLKQGIKPQDNYLWSMITFGKSCDSIEISQEFVEDVLNGDWDLVGENEK